MRFLVQHQGGRDQSLQVDYGQLSPSGIFISTGRPLAQRDTLHVQFAPKKDAQLVSAFCQVTEVTPHGVRASFVSLDRESQELIDSALMQ